ncbi:hypothetical protein E2C01_052605 [Portunus trituberculatus]|uniref:Uncharacterized protein n=1 Tax=Portunus trituberculatus TaxID=210409 RepID=A0A5B7GNP4_PORTR|nr:hypothetical protein [Portunus trituberculatus]
MFVTFSTLNEVTKSDPTTLTSQPVITPHLTKELLSHFFLTYRPGTNSDPARINNHQSFFSPPHASLPFTSSPLSTQRSLTSSPYRGPFSGQSPIHCLIGPTEARWVSHPAQYSSHSLISILKEISVVIISAAAVYGVNGLSLSYHTSKDRGCYVTAPPSLPSLLNKLQTGPAESIKPDTSTAPQPRRPTAPAPYHLAPAPHQPYASPTRCPPR